MTCMRVVAAAGLVLALGVLCPPLAPALAQDATQPVPQFSTGAAPQFAPAQGAFGAPAPAEQPQEDSAAGTGWETQVDAAPSAAQLDARLQRVIDMANAYFNGIVSLQGRFVQIDPDQKRSKGRFYVQRPGLLRFDYAPPSKMRIVADGRFLSIENHDLKTIDKYPLESTPFRMLLRQDVDLRRDARILNYAERDGLVALTIEDRSGESAGQLQLVFALTEEAPGVELKEWIITDPQGLTTRVQLAELERGKEIARDFFAAATIGLPAGFPNSN